MDADIHDTDTPLPAAVGVVMLTRMPTEVESAIDELIWCDECVPDVVTTRLPAGVWELRASHSIECSRPEEIVYV